MGSGGARAGSGRAGEGTGGATRGVHGALKGLKPLRIAADEMLAAAEAYRARIMVLGKSLGVDPWSVPRHG